MNSTRNKAVFPPPPQTLQMLKPFKDAGLNVVAFVACSLASGLHKPTSKPLMADGCAHHHSSSSSISPPPSYRKYNTIFYKRTKNRTSSILQSTGRVCTANVRPPHPRRAASTTPTASWSCDISWVRSHQVHLNQWLFPLFIYWPVSPTFHWLIQWFPGFLIISIS